MRRHPHAALHISIVHRKSLLDPRLLTGCRRSSVLTQCTLAHIGGKRCLSHIHHPDILRRKSQIATLTLRSSLGVLLQLSKGCHLSTRVHPALRIVPILTVSSRLLHGPSHLLHLLLLLLRRRLLLLLLLHLLLLLRDHARTFRRDDLVKLHIGQSLSETTTLVDNPKLERHEPSLSLPVRADCSPFFG